MCSGKMSCMLCLLGCLLLPSSAFAARFEAFSYAVSEDAAAIIITGYTGSCAAVVIPDMIEGLPVVSIGDGAFAERSSLTGITIPAGIISIGDEAFFCCPKLRSAYFIGNAPMMGADVFSYCAKGLTVYYEAGSRGFTSPTWQGYLSELCSPDCPGMHLPGPDSPELDYMQDFGDTSLDQRDMDGTTLLLYLLLQGQQQK